MKISILEYLKRFHEDDEDTYCMVALRFSMHREIAQMLEQSGHKLLRRLHLSKLGEESLSVLHLFFLVLHRS